MALYNFHRVLITATILFDFFFTLWSIRQWRTDGNAMNIVMAVASSAIAIGLVAYLIHFNRSLTVMRGLQPSSPPSGG